MEDKNKQQHANTEGPREGNVSVIFEKISKYEPQREVIKDAVSQSPSRLGLIRPKSNQTAVL